MVCMSGNERRAHLAQVPAEGLQAPLGAAGGVGAVDVLDKLRWPIIVSIMRASKM